MEKISRQQIELLIELQDKEIQASKIESVLKKLPAKLDEMSAGLKEFESSIETKQAALSELKKSYRTSEMDVQTHQSRIKKRDEQLRSVKTNKEYQAILKEIEDIKAIVSKIDDATLDLLEKIDLAEKEVHAKKDEYKRAKEAVDLDKAELEKEAAEEKKQLDLLNSEKDRLSELVEPELFSQYRFIKSITGSVAIAEVKDAVCLGCNINIPPQMYNELHRGNELKNCPHCQRLLYVI